MKRLTSIASVILLMFALMAVMGLSGCGSSSKAMKGESQAENGGEDIDALLGLTNDAPEETPVASNPPAEEETINEDDVLKLLGVEQSGQETAKVTPPVTDPAKNEETRAADVPKNAVTEEQPAGRSTVSKTPPATTPAARNVPFQDGYSQAKSLYDARNYRRAIQEFEALLARNMTHSLSDNCQYWIGESYYGLGKYDQAATAFEKVFTFAKSNKDADAQLKLGLCYLKMNNKTRARAEFQKLIDNYPTYSQVSLARRFISQIDNGQ